MPDKLLVNCFNSLFQKKTHQISDESLFSSHQTREKKKLFENFESGETKSISHAYLMLIYQSENKLGQVSKFYGDTKLHFSSRLTMTFRAVFE